MIDNKKISKFAISVVDDLQKNNFQAYLVGGCVRDALSGIEPKDFDIATNATPEQVRKIFKASRIIGKRFRLVHVFNRSELLEVATFRSGDNDKNDPDNLITDSSGKIIRDNIWGTLEQDCKRRDFTVNAFTVKSLLLQSCSRVPQILSLIIFPEESVMRLSGSFLSLSPDLNVATSRSSDLLNTCTNLNLLPIILDALNILRTCSGVAFVAMSKSLGSIPESASRTHPPTK